MEHDVPQIHGVGRFYFFLALVAGLLTFSSGLKWNIFYEITGILIPMPYLAALGAIIALLFGYMDKIEGKPNTWIINIYPLGFLISFISCYMFFNKLDFTSIDVRMAIGLVIITLLPGFGLLKLVQLLYNRKLEDAYWEAHDQRKREMGQPTVNDLL